MQRVLVVFAVLISLVGCASTPTNHLSNVSNLSGKNLGEVIALVYEKDPKYVKLDETEKLWHWRASWGTLNTDYSWIEKGTNERFQFLQSYCSSRNGTIDGPSELVSTAFRTVKEITCIDAKTNHPIFRVVAGYNRIAQSTTQSRKTGGCVWLSPDQPGFNAHKNLACSEVIDAFMWKSPGTSEDVDRDYKLGSIGFDTAQAVMAEQQQQLQAQRDEQARILQIQKDNEQRKLEQTARERERAIRDLPRVKTVGQRICRAVEITQRKIKGEYRGQPIYGESKNAQAKITAFTENVSGDNIQLRISGMQVGGENVDRIDGDVVYQNGGVIWDNASSWSLCN